MIPEIKQVSTRNLESCTEQEVFDFVGVHLLTQKERALAPAPDGYYISHYCCYRNRAGQTCGAGCLIPEEDYRAEFEEKHWIELIEREIVPSAHKVLIQELQSIHDKHEPAFWADELNKLAGNRGLSTAAYQHLI